MADIVSVTLGSMGEKARSWIANGRYETMDEVVLEGLREIERREALFDAKLKAMVEESLADPGPGIPLEEAFERIRATPIR
jgi:putative addiction module CopG family antidote